MEEEWYTLEDIQGTQGEEKLYCIAVDSPEKQFLAGEIMFPTHNTEQGKAEDELKGEATMILGSIARLGRAAGVHLVIATQRPDAKIISGELKANLGVRINCGRTDSTASSMILGTGDGTRVKSNPRGRLYLRIFGNGDHGQGFFADQEWIDNYLASQGMNPDGSPLSNSRSQLANVADMSDFEGGDLDAREGVDNEAVIERIREQESSGDYEGDEGDDWILDDEEGAGEEQEQAPPAHALPDDGNWGARPQMGAQQSTGNPWDRPEDDWDQELEDLIEENYSGEEE